VHEQLELNADPVPRFERSDVSRGASSGDPLLVASEVAQLLRVTKAWVYAETRGKRLPHIRLGRYVRYRASAIEAWIEEQERASIATRRR
jgi:excisionase family DNA binding protein